MTASVLRDGYLWKAEASLPHPGCFSAEPVVIGGDIDGGIELPFDYVACVIGLIDLSVDKGVQAS